MSENELLARFGGARLLRLSVAVVGCARYVFLPFDNKDVLKSVCSGNGNSGLYYPYLRSYATQSEGAARIGPLSDTLGDWVKDGFRCWESEQTQYVQELIRWIRMC